MIISALLTSVGINLALCLLNFTLYSILRKQPRNVNVYAPRLVEEGKSQQSSRFDIERLLPSASWVKRAWQLSEDDLLACSGLDAVVFMRIFIFSLRVFSVAGILGIFILLPVNYLGNQLRDIDITDIPDKSLDIFSISNVKDGSKSLWTHFSCLYLITGVVCYLLYYEYNYISKKRAAHFYSSRPQPHQFSILVRGIPKTEGNISETVDHFFKEFHSSTYLSHVVIHRSNKIQHLMKDVDNLYRSLNLLKSSPSTHEGYKREGFFGLFGRKIGLKDYYQQKLENVEENVRREQSSALLLEKEVPAAFVCFNSRYGAAIALKMQQSVDPTYWVTEQAPEPYDVYWPFFSSGFLQRWVSKFVVIVATILLIILFLIPVVFVQGLTNLDKVQIWFPFLKNVLSIKVVSQVITGYLPSLILQTFLSFVPPVMLMFSSMQGFISHSEIEKSACFKMLWFTIWNVFFANTLSGSAISQARIFLEPKDIPLKLAIVVPAQASFFIAYVVTSGWTNISSELTRLSYLFKDYLGEYCCKCLWSEFKVPSISYHSQIPKILLFGLLGLTYFILAPLILPFLLVFLCMGYIVYRNQFVNVYKPKYDTGGKFWPIVHNATIFSLILSHAVAMGIFVLKKLPLASSLTVPLPILTFLFNDYCRKRFLPIFDFYSAESLIKKDREDQENGRMDEFFEELSIVYKDPALKPIQIAESSDRFTSPLLSNRV